MDIANSYWESICYSIQPCLGWSLRPKFQLFCSDGSGDSWGFTLYLDSAEVSVVFMCSLANISQKNVESRWTKKGEDDCISFNGENVFSWFGLIWLFVF